MTTSISGLDVAARLEAAFPGVVLDSSVGAVCVPAERVVEIARFLRDDPELDCKYLNCLTAVDWIEYFEIVYHLSSLAKNHAFVLKARASHDMPVVPSVSEVWMGANLQEREAYDLMGIAFSDHPALKRIFLWEGFPGHPLRKDYLALPGGYKPGLQRFPFEFPQGQRQYGTLQDTTEPSAPAVPRLGQPPPGPFPIGEPDTGARLAGQEASTEPLPREQPQGGGTDVSRAGGTAERPQDTVERSHAGPGAGAAEAGTRATDPRASASQDPPLSGGDDEVTGGKVDES